MAAVASSPQVGLSIPGSATRKKAYSVSLREKDFDISEVPVLQDDGESVEDYIRTASKEKCLACGQKLSANTSKHSSNEKCESKAKTSGESSPSSQLSCSLPAEFPK